jgi:hypothetical protein
VLEIEERAVKLRGRHALEGVALGRDNRFSDDPQPRLDDLANRPDQYDWVWNGGFRTVFEGALLIESPP